jgi:hypothetical protein
LVARKLRPASAMLRKQVEDFLTLLTVVDKD